METLLVTLKNEKARKLLQDLEELELLEVKDTSYLKNKTSISKISDLKHKVALPMEENAINQQLEQIRSEWQPNI